MLLELTFPKSGAEITEADDLIFPLPYNDLVLYGFEAGCEVD